MPKRIVICLDGTGNQPKTGRTNVRRLFDMLEMDDSQLAYYDPGVGTLGAPTASSRFEKWATRMSGLVLGHGVKLNVAEAYRFLARNWEPNDRVFIFGFSRGAYTARALTGLLRTAGLLRPELVGNLTEYAMEMYTDEGLPEADINSLDEAAAEEREARRDEWWKERASWAESFANPEFPSRFDWNQVHFLGIWDTVKFVGWLNMRAQLEEAKWPFTRSVENVGHVRHAVAIDERRKRYEEYRINPDLVIDDRRDVQEVWFAGVHSDVGGTFFDDPRLADISLKWMIDEATSQGLQSPDSSEAESILDRLGVDPNKYEKTLHRAMDEDLPASHVEGALHPAGRAWWFTGPGWRTRPIKAGDKIHESVFDRTRAARQNPEMEPYWPPIPRSVKDNQ